MNLEQAKLFARITNHVKGVGEMCFINGVPSWETDKPVCFICEGVRCGALSEEKGMRLDTKCHNHFGITKREGNSLVVGDYDNGPECYEIAKGILTKYGYAHLLDEHSEDIGQLKTYCELYPVDSLNTVTA